MTLLRLLQFRPANSRGIGLGDSDHRGIRTRDRPSAPRHESGRTATSSGNPATSLGVRLRSERKTEKGMQHERDLMGSKSGHRAVLPGLCTDTERSVARIGAPQQPGWSSPGRNCTVFGGNYWLACLRCFSQLSQFAAGSPLSPSAPFSPRSPLSPLSPFTPFSPGAPFSPRSPVSPFGPRRRSIIFGSSARAQDDPFGITCQQFPASQARLNLFCPF